MDQKVENLAWKRGNAIVIDHLIIGLFSVFVLLPTIITISEAIKTPQELLTLLLGSIYTIPAVILIFVFMVFYEPFCTYKYGWTLGKKLLGLRVTDDQGKQLTFAQSALRFIVKSACLSLPYINIAFVILSYFRQRSGKKMIWDEWCQTNVISTL